MGIGGMTRTSGTLRRLCILFSVVVVVGGCAEFRDDPATVSQDVVARATAAVDRFRTLPGLAAYWRFVEDAQGVVVLPRVVKAGFLGAAEGGNGVMLARGADGAWSAPAFYTLGGASFGLQVGIQSTEVLLILRTEKAVRAFLEHQAKLGADAGLTVGMLGGGLEASTTTNLGADVLAFANAVVGAFGGVALEGAVLVRRKDLNEAYYGAGATPQAIIIDRSLENPAADALRAALAGN